MAFGLAYLIFGKIKNQKKNKVTTNYKKLVMKTRYKILTGEEGEYYGRKKSDDTVSIISFQDYHVFHSKISIDEYRDMFEIE